MWCPEKLKLNKFEHVAIPKNSVYFQRLGEVVPPASSFTGDAVVKSAVSVGEQMKDMERYAETDMARQAAIQAEEERKHREAERKKSDTDKPDSE